MGEYLVRRWGRYVTASGDSAVSTDRPFNGALASNAKNAITRPESPSTGYSLQWSPRLEGEGGGLVVSLAPRIAAPSMELSPRRRRTRSGWPRAGSALGTFNGTFASKTKEAPRHIARGGGAYALQWSPRLENEGRQRGKLTDSIEAELQWSLFREGKSRTYGYNHTVGVLTAMEPTP